MKKLYRSRTNHMISGVCGGLGEYYNIEPTFVRIGFALFTLFYGIGLLIYIIMRFVMPYQPKEG